MPPFRADMRSRRRGVFRFRSARVAFQPAQNAERDHEQRNQENVDRLQDESERVDFGRQLLADVLLTVHIDDGDVIDIHLIRTGTTAAAEVQGDLLAVAYVKGLLKQNPIGTVGGADVLAGDLAAVRLIQNLHVDAVGDGLVPEAQLVGVAHIHLKGLVGGAAPSLFVVGTADLSGLELEIDAALKAQLKEGKIDLIFAKEIVGAEDFAAMLEETMIKLRPGQVVKGVVAHVSDDGVVVSIPGKADGYIKKNDLVTTDCKVDDEIEAEVVKLNDGEGYVLLSERKVMATKNWEKLVAEHDTGACVEATGREAVNGGLIADVMGVRAFIPASHLSRRFVENIGEFVFFDVSGYYLIADTLLCIHNCNHNSRCRNRYVFFLLYYFASRFQYFIH